MIHDLESLLKTAAQEVFSTMLNAKVTFELPPPPITSATYVACTIGFTGQFNAVIYLYTSLPFARKITCGLLGLSDDQIEDQSMVNDAMGELTNMHAGHLKSRLCDAGTPCFITIPSIVVGRDFHIVPVSGSQRVTVYVGSGNKDWVLLQLLVKSDSAT
jgi:chemotaxis protein CheX